jgi:hypothetical protein
MIGNAREALAALSHDQWRGWMRYLFSKCKVLPGGQVVIPADLVARWQRQMNTAYADLPANEKSSDQTEADRMIAVYERADVACELFPEENHT